MARGKDLAGLAALGALGYMLNKGKESTTDTGDETARLANRGGPRRQITDYMDKAPVAQATEAPVAKPIAPASRLSPAALTDNTTDINTPTTVYPGGLGKRTEGNQPMPSLQAVEAKIATPKYQASTDAMRNVSRASTKEARAKQFADTVPEELSIQKTDALKNASRAAAAADAARRKAKQAAAAAGMKKGGAVKKMASGGMTRSASSRADGIASRGKTNCKMY